jgi:hypothetical protein
MTDNELRRHLGRTVVLRFASGAVVVGRLTVSDPPLALSHPYEIRLPGRKKVSLVRIPDASVVESVKPFEDGIPEMSF